MSKSDRVETGDIGPVKENRDFEFGPAVHKYTTYSVFVDETMTKEELENPKFWVHVARRLRPGDEIRCMANDSSFVARMVVLYTNGTDARVRCESLSKFSAPKMEGYQADKDYEVKNGGVVGWYVRKISTGERIITKMGSEAEAFTALAEYKKRLAA